MIKKDKESLDHLLIIKDIKKERKYNETTLNDNELKNEENFFKILEKQKKMKKLTKKK